MTASPFARYAARKGTRPAARPGPWVLLAAWGPCGFAPVAPGTFGTLGAIPLYLALSRLPAGGYVAATAALAAIGCFAAERAGRYWGVAVGIATRASFVLVVYMAAYIAMGIAESLIAKARPARDAARLPASVRAELAADEALEPDEEDVDGGDKEEQDEYI